MIERLIPKYPAFLIIGVVILASGLFLLMGSRGRSHRRLG